MAEPTLLILSELDYKIQRVTYDYDESDSDYTFCVSAEIFIPKYQGVLTATFKIDYVLETAEKYNPSMVRYIKTMIESYKEESFWDRLAFEAMEEEGFDLEQLMRYSVNELEVRLTPQ